MSFLFGDSSEAVEGEMGHVFGDGGREDARQDSKTSDGGGESFFNATSAMGGTPTKKDTWPASSQGWWDSGSSGGDGVGLAHPAPATSQPQEDPFLTPSLLPPPVKRSYGPSPAQALPQQQQRGPSDAAKNKDATPGDATRSRENLATVASGRPTSLAGTRSSAVLRELVAMQQKQIVALLPELEEAEGRDRELEAALELVGRESQAYRQQLGALREQYSDRLGQVMGFLQKRP